MVKYVKADAQLSEYSKERPYEVIGYDYSTGGANSYGQYATEKQAKSIAKDLISAGAEGAVIVDVRTNTVTGVVGYFPKGVLSDFISIPQKFNDRLY